MLAEGHFESYHILDRGDDLEAETGRRMEPRMRRHVERVHQGAVVDEGDSVQGEIELAYQRDVPGVGTVCQSNQSVLGQDDVAPMRAGVCTWFSYVGTSPKVAA